MDTLTKEEKLVRDTITQIYDQLKINCRKVCGAGYDKHGDDLLAMCVEFYLEKPLEYQLKVINDGKLEHFLTKMMAFQLKLGTTRYYHQYRKFNEKIRDFFPNYNYGKQYLNNNLAFADEENESLRCVKYYIDKLNPYEKMIINEYIIEGLTYTAISEKYNITYTHIKRDLIKLKKQLKEQCQHFL